MSDLGWICLDRKIMNNWLWQEKPFSVGQAWVDMLLMANHKDNEFLFDGKIIVIERGTFHTSILKLSNRYGWERKKTTKFLNILERQEMVTTKRTTHGTTITIVNYESYQNIGQQNGQQKGQRTGQPMDNARDTNNNDNNDNNAINNTLCASDTAPRVDKLEIYDFFESIWKLYPLKRGKGQVKDAQKKRLYAIGYDEMVRAIGRYKACLEKDEWRKPQNGSTFFNSGYVDYLDANYLEPYLDDDSEPIHPGYSMDYLDDTMKKLTAERGMLDGPFK